MREEGRSRERKIWEENRLAEDAKRGDGESVEGLIVWGRRSGFEKDVGEARKEGRTSDEDG